MFGKKKDLKGALLWSMANVVFNTVVAIGTVKVLEMVFPSTKTAKTSCACTTTKETPAE